MTVAARLQELVLLALPHGGQRTARRNAWSAMSQAAVRARSRRDAHAALAVADRRARRGTGT